MSKRGYITRYMLIIKKLRQKPYSSFEELRQYFERELEFLHDVDDTLFMGISIRTLQRDLREISNLFGIDIEFCRKNKGYHIIESLGQSQSFQRMIESLDLINSLKLSNDLAPIIHFENRKPKGTENLHGLIHAIRKNVTVKFTYELFWKENPTQRTADPYYIKEFRNRWYLLAKDMLDNRIKTFALDRLTELEITTHKFKPDDFDPDKIFKYCFGITHPNDQDVPEEIILSFNAFQGKYIKSLPLHHTQEILIDNEEELKVRLKVFITQELIMELLSLGENVAVLQPESLAELIKASHLNAYRKYVTDGVSAKS